LIGAPFRFDGDTVLNACDNCPELANPGQGPVVFGELLLATDVNTFSWTMPTDVEFVRGDLGSVSGYPVSLSGDLLNATSLTDTASPAVGSGFYYLVRPGGTCRVGSWQTTPGAEPSRDAILP